MKLRSRVSGVWILIAIICMITGSAVVQAEVSVGPGTTEVLLHPGEKSEVVFEVANTWDYDVQVNVTAENWTVRMLSTGGTKDDVYEWLDFGEYRQFVVPRNSQSKLTCDLTAPKDFSGEHIAQVFFEYGPANPTEEQAEIAKAVSQRIGLLLCLGAKGSEKLAGEMKVESVNVLSNENGTKEVKVLYTVMNKGNIHLRPRGSIILKKGDKIVHEENIGPVQGLFSGETRTYETPIKDLNIEAGKYRAELRLKAISYDMEMDLQGSKKFSVKK